MHWLQDHLLPWSWEKGKIKDEAYTCPNFLLMGHILTTQRKSAGQRRSKVCLNSREWIPSVRRIGIFRAEYWEQGAVLRAHTRYLPGESLRVVGRVWTIPAYGETWWGPADISSCRGKNWMEIPEVEQSWKSEF